MRIIGSIFIKELQQSIAVVKSGLAPGLDQIDYSIIKHFLLPCLEEFLSIYNQLLNEDAFPDWLQWLFSSPNPTESLKLTDILPLQGRKDIGESNDLLRIRCSCSPHNSAPTALAQIILLLSPTIFKVDSLKDLTPYVFF